MKFTTCLAIASTVAAVKVSTELNANAWLRWEKDDLEIVGDYCVR